MSVSIQEACAAARAAIDKFEADWLQNNQINPELYPLEVPDDNAGVIIEQICEYITF